jgi:sugar phosphate isomerase/epimerase
MKIYCSTGGFKNFDFFQASQIFSKYGINSIEISSGKFVEDVLSKLLLLNESSDLMLHNYFPPAKIPFVLNLASEDHQIASQSIKFFQNAIKFSSAIKAEYYGIHAGFLFDISVNEIGQKIKPKLMMNREKCLEIFVSRVNNLAKFAMEHNVKLLIENNVLSRENLIQNKQNFLLLVDPTEIINFFNLIDPSVRLLLDVGHLKVSSNTLKFDLVTAFKDLQPLTNGYHLSDNAGESDDHLFFDLNAWFFPYLSNKVAFSTLEINGSSEKDVLKIYRLANAISNSRNTLNES